MCTSRIRVCQILIQQCYYIFGVRLALRSVRLNRFICREFDAQNLHPKWHPYQVQDFHRKKSQPFHHFFDPFFIKNKKKTEKLYASISNCLTTRAAHLESCPDLYTDASLIALARFTARRVSPATTYNDNGKTFVGNSIELKKRLKEIDKNKTKTKLPVKQIQEKFNPPYDTHFGGAWEQLFQIAQRTILIVFGSREIMLDLFNTIFMETETMLSSGPLTNVDDFTDNEEPLTPNRFFLFQRPFSNLPPGAFDDQLPLCFKNWSQPQQQLNYIW